jgi:hypothetical protein
MNPIAAIDSMMCAVKIGEELRSATGWRSAQTVTSLLVAIAACLGAVGISTPFSNEFYGEVGAVVAGLANAYLSAATDKRVGV